MSGGRADPEETTYEVTPIKVGDTLYLCTPHQTAIALDPETGEERWRFDPQVGTNRQRQHQTCQGVSDYEVEGATPEANCARRILLPTSDGRLIALDAATGEICAGFGDQGTVDLSANMPFHAGSYYSTSPPVVACGLIVVGGASTTMFPRPNLPA